MRTTPFAVLLPFALAVPLAAQHIVAATAGLTSAQHVVDFGAGLLPNFTPVSTQFPGLVITHASYFTTGTSNNLVGGFLTNHFGAGPPNTLRIAFASPIRNLSFVYHQIGTSMPSVIRAVLGGVTVDSFAGTWNQSQPNNFFGFRNRHFDELQIDFVGDFNVDDLRFDDSTGLAACGFYNGSGANPADFSCLTTPALGSTWVGLITTTPNTALTFLVFAPFGTIPPAPLPLFGGEQLIDATGAVAFAGLGAYTMGIPNGPGWLGTVLSFQGFRVDHIGPAVTLVPLNAQDLLMGM